MQGWIKLHRQIFENELWFKEPFNDAQAWIDLLLLANHKTGGIIVRGNRIDIQRGQLGWSERSLGLRWKWSRNKVRRYIKWLEKNGNVIQQKSKLISLITLVNYDLYQKNDTTDDTTDDTTGGPQTIPQTDTNKNVKKEKKEKILTRKRVEPMYEHLNDNDVTYEEDDKTPKKYKHKGLFYGRLSVYYMGLKGEQGNAKRHFPLLKDISEIAEKQFPKKTEEQLEKEIKSRILIFKRYQEKSNSAWGLNGVHNNWNAIAKYVNEIEFSPDDV